MTITSLVDIGTCDFDDIPILEKQVEIQLLQVKDIKTLHVNQCKLSITRMITRCSAWEDAQVVDKGLIQYIDEMDRDTCLGIHRFNKFKYYDHEYTVKSNTSLTGYVQATGWADNEGNCKGGVYRDGDNVWKDVVVQLSFKLQITDYQATVGIRDNQIRLRSGLTCSYLEGSCMDSENGNTYWEIATNGITECTDDTYDVLYEGVASVTTNPKNKGGQKTEIYSVNAGEMIFSLAIVTDIYICQMLKAYQTEHSKLIILKKESPRKYFKSKPTEPQNMDMFTYINSKMVYVERHIQ